MSRELRNIIGIAAGAVSIIFSIWIVLGIVGILPFHIFALAELQGIKILAQITVISAIIAAWAYWET